MMEENSSIAKSTAPQPSRLEKFFDPLAGTLSRARQRALVKGDGTSLSLMGLGVTLFGLGVANVLESGGDPSGWTGALYMAISTLNVYNAQGASKRAEANLAEISERIEELTVVKPDGSTDQLESSKEYHGNHARQGNREVGRALPRLR